MIALSALAAAGAFLLLSATSNVWVIGGLVIVIGLGLGFGQPLSMTMVVQLVPAYARATALAIRLTGNRLRQVAGPAAAGLLAGSAGTKPVFWMLSGTLGASAATVLRRGVALPQAPRAERPPHGAEAEPRA